MFQNRLLGLKVHSRFCMMLLIGMAVVIGQATQVFAADNVLPNPGFEEGVKDWSIGEGDSLVTEDAARTGKYGLRVTNNGMKYDHLPSDFICNSTVSLNAQHIRCQRDSL